MELNENKTSNATDSNKIYDSVKQAIIQLNLWVTSIENSFQLASSVGKDQNNNNIYEELYEKMNLHHGRLMRIVQICRELSNNNRLEKMKTINEYITLVIKKFEKLYEQVEHSLKQSEIEIINRKCSAVCDKINDYNNVIQSLFQLFNSNLKNEMKKSLIKNHLQNIKITFYQYNLDIDRIKTTIDDISSKLYKDFSDEINSLNKSLSSIEQMIDNQWVFVIQILNPHHDNMYLLKYRPSDPISVSKTIDERCDYLLQNARTKIESRGKQFVKIISECSVLIPENWRTNSVESNFLFEKRNSMATDRGSPSSADTKCNMVPMFSASSLQDIFEHNSCIGFSGLSQIILSFFVCHSVLYHQNCKSISYSQKPLTDRIHHGGSFINMRKFSPDHNCLCFIKNSVETLLKTASDVNDRMYRDLVRYNTNHSSNFELQYQFLIDFYGCELDDPLSSCDPITQCYSLESKLKPTKTDENQLETARLCFVENLFTKEMYTQIECQINNIQKILSTVVISLVKQSIWFDLSMGCLLFCKEMVLYLFKKCELSQLIGSMFEASEYQGISTTF